MAKQKFIDMDELKSGVAMGAGVYAADYVEQKAGELLADKPNADKMIVASPIVAGLAGLYFIKKSKKGMNNLGRDFCKGLIASGTSNIITEFRSENGVFGVGNPAVDTDSIGNPNSGPIEGGYTEDGDNEPF